ncbi:MAG TPA: pitrilysin family protein [Vicinamibacterales bacterium]|jgi:zinc protease|nr:pitrilysin family protein [Vicinamibacterales bacterium]
MQLVLRRRAPRLSWIAISCVVLAAGACAPADTERLDDASTAFTIELPYEHYTLDNGLEVLLHEDHSDPIVAVATIMHVGSSRERPGKTGFAHFFEHMSFNDSENVPVGSNRKLIPELGGTRNGGTSSDMTIYYEVVPKDAFEKILWIDSDRLGYMINTVTEAALEREKQVVKNEKRQRVDNAPYGHTQTVQRAALYPEEHPYHWTVIGSLDDLQSATLEDVSSFYTRLYGANNATLVIAGDIDIGETKRLVDYWFGEIRRGPEVRAPYPQPVYLEASRSLMYEDNFATLPELQIVFPSVEQFHEDQYALDILTELLAGNKQTPLYEVIVEERQLAPNVVVGQRVSEIAGELVILVRANAGTDLDAVKAAVDEGLAQFEAEGVDATALRRVKVQAERAIHERVGSVLDKAFELAEGNEFTGDPNHIATVARETQQVTAEDVMAVYDRYIKDRTYVMTSFVPRGQPELAVEGAEPADVVEEKIIQGAEAEVSQGEEAVYKKTASEADRSEPPLGDPPLVSSPEVWTARQENGLELLGIENDESALVAFDLTLPGGQLLDPPEKTGVAGLLASLMMEGTSGRTPAELEEALDLLGARVNIFAGREAIRISGSTLARTFEPTMALVEELLLEPRWDRDEFDRLRRELATRLRDQAASPTAIANNVFGRVLYGDDHAFGNPVLGTPETVADIEIDDLKRYFAEYVSPSRASFHVAGAVSQGQVQSALAGLSARWPAAPFDIPQQPVPPDVAGRTVYFVDVPDAKQSVLQVGRLALSATDPDYTRLDFANERIGGSSSGRLFQLLRIEKGYTYGATSGLVDTVEVGPWMARTSVRANVTLESLELIRDQIQTYAETFTEEDVEVTKNQIIKGNTRAFESLNAKLGLLRRMSRYDLPPDFVERDQELLLGMTQDDFRDVITTHLDESRMIYVVVGDAETQLGRMAGLGYGEPVVLDIYGRSQ